MRDILAELEALRAHDLPTHGGRTLAYVYDSGLAEADRVGLHALTEFGASNGLDPTAFPSLLQIENELVGFAADLLDAPATAVGTATSGGTESILLAVQAARDARPDVTAPAMVLPSTAHAAFHKAAHYFGVRTVVVPVRDDYRADPAATAAAVDELDGSCVLVVASAPSYAHGVVDPVPELAGIASSYAIRCHVDACIGGWVLPYATRLGRNVPPWTFAVDGVASISVDLHKYAYTPKGASLLLHRTPDLRRPQFFAWADWPGYTMLNSTAQSTKSGGPLAAAWAVVHHIGDDGYLGLAAQVLDGMDRLLAGLAEIPALHVVASPDSTLVALAADETCDVFTIADEVNAAGWYVQPQLSHAGAAPTLHLSLSAATATHVEEFCAVLGEAVRRAVAVGPVGVDPGVADVVRALDPATLSDDDFDGLLDAAGMAGEDGVLPERMAPVNALLDLATPRLREALLTAFLDRLSRPSRRPPKPV
ncbi:MAG TPA: aminotransferase class V-fold PLP-dependent enzyme [Nocardioidaceae bacterium]|nr:aminotransferase class V-fold PLP-dependent enzyme [Nocardioidaceae bacterium]